MTLALLTRIVSLYGINKLTTKKQKATEVYLSAGFENLSHFSFAFKKKFGYSPRALNSN
ncbi:MAG: hypothetical protein CMO01_15670 [Thalassobius sp.]|nr:hypothetical protein [Thalassovita sp.]